jgi:hypothetical protein
MHGSEHRIRSRRTIRPSAPLPPFSKQQVQRFRTRRKQRLHLEPEARNGLSLPWNDCRLRSLHSRINGPGLLLRFPLAASSTRSAFWLRNRSRFAPVTAASSPQTRCQFHNQRDRLHPPPPLPFGSFTSLRIKAFNGASSPPTRLPVRPISVRSPLPFLLLVPAAAHRSRLATSRSYQSAD